LGSVTTICSDKTGTLTENRMTVSCLEVMGHHIDLPGPERHATVEGEEFILPLPVAEEQSQLLKQQPAVGLLLTGAALCNDAFLECNLAQPKHCQTLGDPTESALVVAAADLGLWKGELEKAFKRIGEVPFDADRKRMTTIHELPKVNGTIPQELERVGYWWLTLAEKPYIAFTKGAVDSLLQISSQVWVNGKIAPLNNFWYRQICNANDQLAGEGIRVLGVAFRALAEQAIANLSGERGEEIVERDLIFVGMVGMIDPPRPEVKEAVLTCQKAGIRPVMITGDHPLTARHIASELSISNNGLMLTGQDLAQLSTQDLENLVEEVSVYARVSPQHKLEIVQALQNRGHIVAMTGDGVNDA
ncbi:MAG TPA: ATPase, partial [Cyanobacteria bacterium UBA9273]|nr:ATPase [Cyanobacteria bacterium UBA9273]